MKVKRNITTIDIGLINNPNKGNDIGQSTPPFLLAYSYCHNRQTNPESMLYNIFPRDFVDGIRKFSMRVFRGDGTERMIETQLTDSYGLGVSKGLCMTRTGMTSPLHMEAKRIAINYFLGYSVIAASIIMSVAVSYSRITTWIKGK